MRSVHTWSILPCSDHQTVINGPKYSGFNGRMPIPVIIATQCPHCVVVERVVVAKPEPQPPEPQGPGMITQLENAVVVLEEISEPKAWARKAAFALARVVRAKLH